METTDSSAGNGDEEAGEELVFESGVNGESLVA